MKKGLLVKLIPHIFAVLVFLLVAVIFCAPTLQGKVLNQQDVTLWKGTAQQSLEYKDKYGHFPLWTNSVFSGMPAYTIAMEPAHTIPVGYVYGLMTLWLPKPMNFFFLACICFYFLCLAFRIKPWVGVLASLAYAYSTFDPVIIAVGHDTQMTAIALAPAVLGSYYLILQKKYWLGAALLAVSFSFQVSTQHIQIIYYTGMMVLFMTLAFIIYKWRRKELKDLVLPLFIGLGAALIGFLTFAVTMLPLREYAKETMRGGHSALTEKGNDANKTQGGLNKDYAFYYSYGIPETLTFIVPGIYGGSAGDGQEHTSSTAFTEKLTEAGVPEDQAMQMANAYSYWGYQPTTSGPVYLGAVVCFLFILGMVFLRGWNVWWIIATTVVAVILAWGKNFAALNYFLFDHLPLYNKFRAPTMSLVIPQLTFPLTAALVLQQILFGQLKKEVLWKKFRTGIAVTGGLVVLLFLLYITFGYQASTDTQLKASFASSVLSRGGAQPSPQLQQQAESVAHDLVSAVREDRKSLFGSDLLRSVLLIGIAALLLWAFIKEKMKPMVVAGGLLVLTAFDLLGIGKRYLNTESFLEPNDAEAAFIPTEADKQMLADNQKPFRVFDQTDPQGPFQSSRVSYFFNSIGGYSPAKLSIYQDLIDHQLSKGNMAVYNMLNTRYFIMQNPSTGKVEAQLNQSAFGPVWLVKGLKFVSTPDDEMGALDHTSLSDTAVVQQKFANQINIKPVNDSTASIHLIQYRNDTLRYAFNAAGNQFAVFSEIYYPLGWNAYIDGKKSDYVKTDYALRGMAIPAGRHEIEFRFEPGAYWLGDTLSVISGYIVLFLLILAVIMEIKRKEYILKSTVN